MPNASLVFKTAVYEGPLDLLLDLIEKRKLLINDISLAKVTDEFLSRIQAEAEMPIKDTAEFVALAATLLLIKSRSLLPLLELTGEEEQDIKQLEYRLAVYQIIKNTAKGLEKAGRGKALFAGEAPVFLPLYVPDPTVTQASLRAAITSIIENFPQFATLPSVVVKKIISLEEMIDKLSTRVSAAFSLSFKEFSGHGKGQAQKGDVIITFLALLELVKQGIIRATQTEGHGDILLENDSVSTPTYE
ncbi:MAG: segregation/condensation protein A [Patescibacteria group bacterium]